MVYTSAQAQVRAVSQGSAADHCDAGYMLQLERRFRGTLHQTASVPGADNCPVNADVRETSRRGGVSVVYQVNAASVEWNPSTERLRELTEKMPNSQLTEFGNVAVKVHLHRRRLHQRR
jgi:hypothetical protein